VDLAEDLARRGIDFEQLVVPDEVHGFLLHRNWVAAIEDLTGLPEPKAPEWGPFRHLLRNPPMIGPAALAALFVLLSPGSALPCAEPRWTTGDDGLKELYEGGVTFQTFLEEARRRRDMWLEHYGEGRVPEGLQARARAVPGHWRLLVVAEDWCSDSVNTIPYVARLVEQVEGLEMSVIRSREGRALMEAHRTPDGRASTPTVLLLDEKWNEAGCFIERPAPLQDWVMQHRPEYSSEKLHEHMFEWYDDDAGASTIEQVVAMLEAAAVGESRCAKPDA
jgi:hypothetical protein